jgi:hypothetical protein
MTRLLTPFAALLLVASAAPAQDVPDLVDPKKSAAIIVDRLGRLPAELVKAKKTDAEMVEALFLAALGRFPKEDEAKQTVRFLAAAKNREEAGRDIAWALVHSKEFLMLRGLDRDPAAAFKMLTELISEWGKKEKDKKDKK